MSYPFYNLVFEGGGVKGIAYVGALQVLREKDVMQNIKRTGGTSAGAIIALLVGLGYTVDELHDILFSLDFGNFLDDSWGIVQDAQRLVNRYGWYKGDFFRNWITNLISQKTGLDNATFSDIQNLKSDNKYLDMYFVGTNISTRFSTIFSYEHTPNMQIADAVRISMSVPLFFTAPQIDNTDYYVDGGVLDNYPVRLFDRTKYVETFSFTPDYYKKSNSSLMSHAPNCSPYVYNKETLGFRLDSKSEIPIYKDNQEPVHYEINNFFDYTWSLIETLLECQQDRHLNSNDWQRTIYINTLGVRTMDFDISDEKKQSLIDAGRLAAEEYINLYESNKIPPVNHPFYKHS